MDIVDIGHNKYVFIAPNYLNFVSEITEGDISQIAAQEEKKLAAIPEEGDVEFGPSIAFMPTFDCNLRCIYCYARGGEHKENLSMEIARRAIDNLVLTRPNHSQETLSIYFVGGGEPFVNFACMQWICEYAKTLFPNTQIILVSNGTFGHKQYDWLIENNVALRISYDALAHEQQRPFATGKNSQMAVEENICKIASTDLPLTIQITITNDSVALMADSVEHVASLGVKYVKIEPVHCSTISRASNDTIPDVSEFVKYFIASVQRVLDKELLIKIDNSFISRPTTAHYCGSGSGENITITPNGYITACLEISHPNDPFGDVMILGDTLSQNGFNLDAGKRAFLSSLHYTNYDMCRACNLKLICGGGCPMQSGWDNGSFYQPSLFNCQIHKALIPRLFALVFSDSRVLDVLFDNHAVKIC